MKSSVIYVVRFLGWVSPENYRKKIINALKICTNIKMVKFFQFGSRINKCYGTNSAKPIFYCLLFWFPIFPIGSIKKKPKTESCVLSLFSCRSSHTYVNKQFTFLNCFSAWSLTIASVIDCLSMDLGCSFN